MKTKTSQEMLVISLDNSPPKQMPKHLKDRFGNPFEKQSQELNIDDIKAKHEKAEKLRKASLESQLAKVHQHNERVANNPTVLVEREEEEVRKQQELGERVKAKQEKAENLRKANLDSQLSKVQQHNERVANNPVVLVEREAEEQRKQQALGERVKAKQEKAKNIRKGWIESHLVKVQQHHEKVMKISADQAKEPEDEFLKQQRRLGESIRKDEALKKASQSLSERQAEADRIRPAKPVSEYLDDFKKQVDGWSMETLHLWQEHQRLLKERTGDEELCYPDEWEEYVNQAVKYVEQSASSRQ